MRSNPMSSDEAIERCEPVVRRVIRSRIRDLHSAEDLCQEALLKCCRYFRTKGEIPSEPYVVQMALNECRSWTRKHGRRCQPEYLDSDIQDAKGKGPATRLEERERLRAVFSAIDTLPSHYREAVRLRLLVEWPSSWIAKKMGMPIETVKTRVNRAKGMLRKKLKCLVMK
jgi:RNA polymerase sigma-70 factor (ECF subfamily)